MSNSPLGSLVCELESTKSQDHGPAINGNLPARGVPQPQVRVWIPTHRKSGAVWRRFPFLKTLLGAEIDPRQLELEEADRKALLEHLQKMYHRMANSLLWSMAAFILADVGLVPLLGWLGGLLSSIAVAILTWMILDRVGKR